MTKKFNTGPTGDKYPKQTHGAPCYDLGPAVAKPIPLPTKFPPVADLRKQKPDMVRTVVFDDTPRSERVRDRRPGLGPRPRRSARSQLGDLEEWHVQNASQEFHVFHIHQGDFQVTEINGVAAAVHRLPGRGEPAGRRQKTGAYGEVVMRMKFDPPIIVGEFVYHCHIVQHEDQGMMANVLVEDELAKSLAAAAGPDLIADALTPATGNFWCKSDEVPLALS